MLEITLRPKVLLIDDEIHFLNSFAELLESEGLDVITTSNADDALKITDNDSNIKLIITDLSLPDNNNLIPDGKVGLNLIESISLKHPNIPIIVLSAYLERYAKELGALGASAYISKGSPEVFETVTQYTNEILEDRLNDVQDILVGKSDLVNKIQAINNELKSSTKTENTEERKLLKEYKNKLENEPKEFKEYKDAGFSYKK